MPKFFHSMYVKWTLTFVALLLIAQAITVEFSFRAIVTEMSEILADKLERKAEFIIRLHDEGHGISYDIMAQIGVTDIEMIFLSRDIAGHPFADILSFEMQNRALRGEIAVGHIDEPFHRVPFVVFALGDDLVLLSPILPQNELTLFVTGFVRAVFFNILLSSVFVSGALVVIILKIRRVTAATREVARGNFGVTLFTRSNDEVGELMRNFNAMTKELRQSEYLKKDFVSSISHEFKTPITAIEGFAKLLRNKNLTQEQFNEYTEIIIKETARLGGLSTNLLRLSLLDHSEQPPAAAPFYMDEQIRHGVLLLERAWEEKDITFDINMPPLVYNGNEELLSQVWINILQNAVKFSPAGGVIGVDMTEEAGFVVVKISDMGPGIAPQHHDKIFTRFYKGNKQDTEGNGLGLPIAKRIVEMCGGEIGFESERGRTVFFVRLPG